jgi:hypothetical protein
LLSKDGARDSYDRRPTNSSRPISKGIVARAWGDGQQRAVWHVLVVDALINNKDFDLIVLRSSSTGVDNNYMTRRRWDYFVRHLLGEPPQNTHRAIGADQRGRIN